MKAAVLEKYSKTDLTLKIKESAKPMVASDEVLVEVKAAGVNPLDNMITRGEVKLIVDYKLPLVMGNELAGVVVEVGSNVKNFKVGDRVFGRLPLNKIGAFAQFVAVDKNALAIIPDYLNFTEAAAVPLTALTAVQALELMNVEEGKTIFISGGTGGLGAMAIPIAHAKGLKVITNGSQANEERVKALGASRFIDYKKEDYTKVLENVDYVLDTLGGAELEKQFSILKNGGKLVSLKGVPNKAFAKKHGMSFFKTLLFTLAGSKYDKMAKSKNAEYNFIFVESNGKQLEEVANLFEKLNIKPSIDTVYPFDEVNKALDKVANGRSKGKTILEF